MFSCETCETFKNIYFEEYLRTAASVFSVAKISNSVKDITPEFCYPFILGHTGKVGPVTRDPGSYMGPRTQDPSPETPQLRPGTNRLHPRPESFIWDLV